MRSKKYLLAHAMTLDPEEKNKPEELYMAGQVDMDEKDGSIWVNEKENVIMLDCGCGLPGGKLACISLDTGERYYA